MATPSAGIGKQRIRDAVGSDDTQRAGKKQREPEVWQDGHTLTVPTSRRAPIPVRNGSGRSRSTFECQQRQDASIPLLEKRARRRGRALLYPPGSGRSCVFTVGKTICRARELPAITRSGYCISQATRHRVTWRIQRKKPYQVAGRGSREKGEARLAAQRTPHRVLPEEGWAVTSAQGRGRTSRAGAWARGPAG